MHSNYDSVVEQTGIFAGKGGFDVTVGEHTQLDGAVIGSTATADKNKLDTGTLGFSDIHNQADYKVEHQSIGLSTGGSIAGQFAGNMANTMLAGVNKDGHDSGTTRAAVSDGTLVVRDQDKQAQDLANLSRDAENANGSINQIFDKEKEQKRIQQAQLIGELSTQVSDIVRTQGAIAAATDAKEKMGNISQEDRDKARADWIKANPGKEPDEKALNKQVYQNFYDKAFNDTKLGTGGAVQQGIQAATAAVQGLAGGDIAAAIANDAAPYLAEVIGHKMGIDNNTEAKAIAHAIVGAALAAAQGQNAAAGATGAALGEITAGILKDQLYGKDTKISDLTETQKQTLSALATLSSGLAGGLVGDSTGSAVYAAQAGKTTAENNHLNTIEKITLTSKEKEYAASCSGENAGNSACTGLKQDIDKLHEKGQSIDKKEASELGPDFQLGGVDSIEHNPGDVVSCVNSSNGFCVVTEKTAANGREWMLAPADEIQAIAAKNQNGKTEDFIKELGAAYLEAGCGMPGVASALCQTYSAAGGANPISGRVPTDAERVTWAMAAAANTVGNITALKATNGSTQSNNLASQAHQELVSEINKFPSKTQATNTSTMIGAYDPITGKTAVGSSNAAITAEALHPTTVAYIEKRLGVKIGEFTSFCKNKAGACAEVSGADILIRQGANPENIKFTQAMRPREVWKKESITPKAIVETCENCGKTWPKGTIK